MNTTKTITGFHPKNKHHGKYDFKTLIAANPDLATFVAVNEFGTETIDFANPDAVKMLNKALLLHFYGLKNWDIPKGFLCPPIPGRADYIHYLYEFRLNKKAIYHDERVDSFEDEEIVFEQTNL